MIWCTLNFQGLWSDTELAKQLYVFLDNLPDRMTIAADSVFTRGGGGTAGKILLPPKADKLESFSNSVSVKAFIAIVKRHQLALSIRQAAEDGLNTEMLQKTVSQTVLKVCTTL